MKTADKLQQIITALAAKHGIDLGAAGAHLHLEQPSFMPLVIENIGLNRVSVAHYYYQHGDAIADPDVELFYGYGPWAPLAIQHAPPFGYHVVATLHKDASGIARINHVRQEDLVDFCDLWADNITWHKWLEYGQKK